MAEFASKGVAGAGLGTGIAGLSLGVLNALGNGGILPALLGGAAYNGAACCSENTAVNRYELDMSNTLAAKDAEIGLLKSQVYVDQKIVDTYTAIMNKVDALAGEVRANKDAQCAVNANQAVLNATTNAALGCINERVGELRAIIGSITKTVVPNNVICPGWGDVTVTVTPAATTTT